MAWRCRFLTARRSQHGRVVADDEGTEADEAKYDSLVADITRKVAEMASLKGPRASVTAARLSKLLERGSDSEEDSDDYTACS